jgi:diacylglycerol O-acyltransferase
VPVVPAAGRDHVTGRDVIGRGTSGPRCEVHRPSPLGELGIGLATFAAYLVADGIGGPGRATAARANAESLGRLERRLHLDVEATANAWLASHSVLRVVANYEYATTYVVAAFGLLLWLYARRPEQYRPARSSFVLLNLLAIACFVGHPVTPPRLLVDHGFVDTVALGRTWGSWGSPLVAVANQHAAMPSLHLGWALWVSVVLARVGGLRSQALSAVHVVVTTGVILGTANHFVLDTLGAVVVVLLCCLLFPARRPESAGTVVSAADRFFLHVESSRYPQQVGGVVPLQADMDGVPPLAEDVVAVVRARLDDLPRFRQRLEEPSPRWRRPRWVDHGSLDWGWHVSEVDPAGRSLDDVVVEVAATPLPRDRPLWRIVVVTGPHQPDDTAGVAVILVVHHVIADGAGTVAQALRLLEPVPSAVSAVPEAPAVPSAVSEAPEAVTVGSAPAGPAAGRPYRSSWRSAWWLRSGGHRFRGRLSPGHRLGQVVAVAVGLVRFAALGRAPRWPGGASASGAEPCRSHARLIVPLPSLRQFARDAEVRVTDVLLYALSAGVAGLGDLAPPRRLRVVVPLMARDPAMPAEGNATAAIMLDLPSCPMDDLRRLREVARNARRLRTPSWAAASRFVMTTMAGELPPPLHRLFARIVYGSRFFHAIASNIPGSPERLRLVGREIQGAFPLIPLAPGTPLAVGALGWNGLFCVSVMVADQPGLTASRLAGAMAEALTRLGLSAEVQAEVQAESLSVSPRTPAGWRPGGARRRSRRSR